MSTRRERVVLELVDDLSPGMVKAAAATKLLDRELNSLSGSSVTSHRAMGTASRDIDNVGTSSRRTSADINQLSGRLSLLLRGFALVGPALAPISTVAVAGVAGLSSQLGFAATGAISLAAAAQGVGDALKAVNDAALEPTAANLEKAREAMSKIGPDAQAFVTRFQEIRPVLRDIRDSAAAGWFPGLTESLNSLEKVGPEVASLFEKIGTVGGNLVAEGAAALAGPGWADFRRFVAAEAPQALDDLGRTLGNVAKGLSELWVAFGPLNSSFSSWLLDASRSFAQWADGLAETEGFAEFVDYIRTNGPKVAAAAKAIGNAFLQIAEAAAPLGGPILDALTGIADAIATIADSPLGTPIMTGVSAMSALTLATNLATAAMARLGIASKGAGASAAGIKLGPTGALIAGAAINQGAADAGDKAQSKTGDINWFQASPVNAMNALVQWDADKFLPADIIKRLVTGKDKVDDLGDAADDTGSAFDGLADQADAATQAIREQSRVTLGAFSAETAYREALKAATEQAAKNNAGIKGNSEAALANRASLEQLAGAWQRQRDELVEADAATEKINRKQAEAQQAFIRTATAMGVPIKKARELAKELLGIPETTLARVDVDAATAKAALRDFKAQLDSIRNKNITVSTTFQNHFDGPGGKGKGGKTPKVPQVPGVTVPGQADGGTVPRTGLPYADRHPYLLADGEEVISNRYGQADRHRPLLKAINAGLLADGGTAGGWEGFRRLANGGTARGKGGKGATLWLLPDEFDGSLKAWSKALEESRDTLQRENEARASLVKELGDTVGGMLTSPLFQKTDSWAIGGSWQDAIGTLLGDTSAANAYSGNVDRLKALGLDDPNALNALLTQADPAAIANLAATATPEVIAQYEQTFADRQNAIANAQATAMNAQTAALSGLQAAANAKLDQINAQLAALNSIQKAAPAATGKATAKAGKKGAGNGGRNIKKG